jgi:hypothetical protein
MWLVVARKVLLEEHIAEGKVQALRGIEFASSRLPFLTDIAGNRKPHRGVIASEEMEDALTLRVADGNQQEKAADASMVPVRSSSRSRTANLATGSSL